MNPFDFIDHMTAGDFLVFYGIIAGLALITGHLAIRLMDPTADLVAPRVPSNPDPYTLAYLRGGVNEVSRLAILDLMERDYLEVETKRWWRSTEQRLARTYPSREPPSLPPILRIVYRWFVTSKQPKDIFSANLPAELVPLCRRFEDRLQAERLLNDPSEAQSRSMLVIGLAGGAILFFGLYRLWTSLSEGRNNIELMLIEGAISLVLLWNVAKPTRVSRVGKTYLANVQLAYESLKPGHQKSYAPGPSRQWVLAGATDMGTTVTHGVATATPVFAAGVFGFEVLAGSEFEALRGMFSKAASSRGGGCGGGCGGCGSCGGCGGCGCG